MPRTQSPLTTPGAPQKRRGRPPKPAGESDVTPTRSIRLDDERWATLRVLGREWLERQLDRARRRLG